MRYWSNPPHTQLDDTRPTLDKLSRPGPRLYFAVAYDGHVVGTCGVHGGDEIGYIFHPRVWGQGIAKEALGAVIAHIWDTTDKAQITADVDPQNLASVGLLTRLGFLVSGFAANTFCIGGAWSDSVYFRLPRPV